MTYDDIIDQLDGLSGPNIAIDEMIRRFIDSPKPLPYTGSLDAAMSLFPTEALDDGTPIWYLDIERANYKRPWVQISKYDHLNIFYQLQAPTLVLAICIVAMVARKEST